MCHGECVTVKCVTENVALVNYVVEVIAGKRVLGSVVGGCGTGALCCGD